LILPFLADAAGYLHFDQLGLDPVALDLGFFQIKWYSLGYIVGIFLGWWLLLKLLAQPGAPMAKRHADDLVFYITLGTILGGRLGYVLFYKPEMLMRPLEVLQLWEGGMSFHGGLIGVVLGLVYAARKHGLNFLRVCDYVAVCVPPAILFVRLANFVNGELWGRPTTVPWAIVFPRAGPEPRHPSQLYEAAGEGLILFLILWFLFWRTDARYQPGKLVGVFALGYGLVRFAVEWLRNPDAGLENLAWGLTMGQTLSLPLIVVGAYFLATAKGRRQRVEPIAGGESVA
jgi:phosphatidylglycerol:prolipoprotein diacylglycerol transferase